MKAVNIAFYFVRFLLELCLVAGLAVAGAAVSWWAAIGLPLVLVTAWARFVAPKSRRRLTDPTRLAVEIMLFVGTGAALAVAGHLAAGIALSVASTVVGVAVRQFDDTPWSGPDR